MAWGVLGFLARLLVLAGFEWGDLFVVVVVTIFMRGDSFWLLSVLLLFVLCEATLLAGFQRGTNRKTWYIGFPAILTHAQNEQHAEQTH